MTKEQILDKATNYGYAVAGGSLERCNISQAFMDGANWVNDEIAAEKNVNDVLDELANDNATKTIKANHEFINYLANEAIGDIKSIIECYTSNESNEFIGYVTVHKYVSSNQKLMIEFDVTENNYEMTYKAEWQPYDNYAVYQTVGCCGDDYSGYLLFPTHKDNRYFCLKYTC